MGRDAFRQRLLDPTTADETIDQLRRAAKGIVDAQTHAELGAATELFKTFEKLATTMELEKDAEFDGVARIRSSAKWSPV
jgi:hypothetical protein